MKIKTIKYFKKQSCIYKHSFDTMKEALDQLFNYQEKEINVNSCYKCCICNKYHIGHYNNNKSRRYQRRKIIKYIINHEEILCQI